MYRTWRVWRYNAAANAWAVVRAPPPEGMWLPRPSLISARTNLDAYMAYNVGGRVDWYHAPNPAAAPVWQQVRWGNPGSLVTGLSAIRQAPGRAYAVVIEDLNSIPQNTRVYRRTLQGAWVQQVQRPGVWGMRARASVLGCCTNHSQPRQGLLPCTLTPAAHAQFETPRRAINIAAAGPSYTAMAAFKPPGVSLPATTEVLESVNIGAFRVAASFGTAYDSMLAASGGGQVVAVAMVRPITGARLLSRMRVAGAWTPLPDVIAIDDIHLLVFNSFELLGLVVLDSGSAVMAWGNPIKGVLRLQLP